MTDNMKNVANEGHRHECLNCGTEYEGNFCPECGQRATVSRLTIGSVFEHFMALAGFSNGKLMKTVWHYIIRPGHMMREYFQGKRATYIRPLNILVVMSLFFVIVQLIIPDATFVEEVSKEDRSEIIVNGRDYADFVYSFMDFMEDWFRGNKGYYRLLVQLLCIPGTMLCFKKSKVFPHSNLAENFFIQVFLSNQLLVLELLCMVITWGKHSLPIWLFPLLMIYDYKQLFGFSWGRTTWKTIKVYLFYFLVLILFFIVVAACVSLVADKIGVPVAS